MAATASSSRGPASAFHASRKALRASRLCRSAASSRSAWRTAPDLPPNSGASESRSCPPSSSRRTVVVPVSAPQLHPLGTVDDRRRELRPDGHQRNAAIRRRSQRRLSRGTLLFASSATTLRLSRSQKLNRPANSPVSSGGLSSRGRVHPSTTALPLPRRRATSLMSYMPRRGRRRCRGLQAAARMCP